MSMAMGKKTAMIIIFIATICAAGVLQSQQTEASQISSEAITDVKTLSPIVFHFSGASALSGWSVTKTATAVPHDNCLEIQGSAWDSKIFRVITLPAGRYVMSGRAAEQARVKIMTLDWRKTLLDFNLSNSNGALKTDNNGWNIDSRDFVSPGGELYLIVEVNAAKGVAKIASLKIETAPVKSVDNDAPSLKAPAKETVTISQIKSEVIPEAKAFSPIKFLFSGASALAGWSVTKTATTVSHDNCLEIQGSGWDSKIFRIITLPAGRYVMFGRAAEKTRVKIMTIDWRKNLLDFNLSTAKDTWQTDKNGWRIDYRDFESPGGELYLTVEVSAEKGIAKIESLKIESAPPKLADKDTPSPEALAKETAKLRAARGFMMGYVSKFGPYPMPDESVYKEINKWGANLARLDVWPALQWPKLAQNDFWNKGLPVVLDHLEANVILARKAGVKIVVDCHFPPPVDGKLLDHGTNKFWGNPETTAAMCRLWKAIAERLLPYKDAVFGYDLFNEPLDWGQIPYEPREWRTMATEIIKTIRTVDKDTWIIYEPGPGGLLRGFDGLVPLPDIRVIYSVHFYYPSEFCAQGVTAIEGTDLPKIMEEINVRYPATIKGVLWDKRQLERMLAPVDEFQKKWHVPVYVGEFSVIRWAPKEDAVRWLTDVISLFEARGWSWTYHAFRENSCWSLEHDETYLLKGAPPPAISDHETERAKVIKNVFKKNWNSN
ncbi:MAG: cellulase family glycosylhydrolase [Victivallaceae bacterium]